MGYSMRTSDFRFTRWQKYKKPEEIVAVELYDHSDSKTAGKNLAASPEYKTMVKEFNLLLDSELNKYKVWKEN
jgi:hypothetical protein